METAVNTGYIEIGSDDEMEENPVVQQFTEWANEPAVADLKQDLSDAQSAHDDHVGKVDTWLDNLNVKGKARRKKIKGRSSLVPKLIRKQAEWRYAALSEPFLSTDDVFNVDPVTFEDREAAKQNALVLNNQFNTKIQKVKFFDEFVRTAVDEGTVLTRVGWNFQEVPEKVMVPDFQLVPVQDPQMAQQLSQVAQMIQQQSPELQGVPPELMESAQMSLQHGGPVQKVQVGEHEEIRMKTVANHPTLEICDYNNLTIDPSCRGDMEKAQFAVWSFETSKAELEKDGKYQNLDHINVETNSILGTADHAVDDESSFNFTDSPRKKFVAHEYWGNWDIHGDGITTAIVATWVGDTMIRLEENPFPDKKVPFVSVQYLPVRKKIYGEPDGELLKDNQKIVGAVTRGMMDIMGRSANGQTGTRKDALDTTNRRKYEQGLDYEFNQAVTPDQAFFMHKYPEIPQSAQFILGQQNAEAESLTGVKAFNSGITGAALGDNATGIRSALDATSKRELGILRRLAEGVKQIGHKFISMNAVFLEETEVIRITNEKFVEVRRDDLAGKIDLSLTISTAEADNDKAEQLAFMLQTMGPNQDPEVSNIMLADIFRLRKMPGLAKKIEDYKPEPDPLAIRKAELENELLEAEIAKERSIVLENEAEAALDYAKERVELAKIRQMSAVADQADLDYVEQEGGTKQERELQKAGAQANANRLMKHDEHRYKMAEEAAKPTPVKASA